jgi:hypothetical protein
VPQHIAEMVLVLLWMWRAAMESFRAGNGLSDSAMKPLMLPVAQLAVGGGCKRTGSSLRGGRGRLPTISQVASGRAKANVSLCRCSSAALDVVMTRQCIVHCRDSLGGQHSVDQSSGLQPMAIQTAHLNCTQVAGSAVLLHCTTWTTWFLAAAH